MNLTLFFNLEMLYMVITIKIENANVQEMEGLTGGTLQKTRIPFPYRTSKPQTNDSVEFGGTRNGTPDAGRLKARRATRITCGSVCPSYRLGDWSTNFPAAYVKPDGYRPTTESANSSPLAHEFAFARTRH